MISKEVIIKEHNNIFVVRDDLISGGTKRRFLVPLLMKLITEEKVKEFVYPGTALGAAIIAMGYSIAEVNELQYPARAKIFIADRKEMNNIMKEAFDAGQGFLQYEYVKMGFYKNVIAATEKYSQITSNVHYFKSGLYCEYAINEIANIARNIKKDYNQFDAVFSACSSGTLQAGLQRSELGKKYYAVGTGMKNPPHGIAELIEHYKIQKFEQKAKIVPPYPTFLNYDGKVWQYAVQYKKENPNHRVLLWNVATPKL